MTEFKIYQINSDRDGYRAMFLNLKNLERFTGSSVPDSSIYDLICAGSINGGLEDIFREFNSVRTGSYIGRSVSVSDVIEITSSQAVDAGYYFVDSWGFTPVPFDPSKTVKAI